MRRFMSLAFLLACAGCGSAPDLAGVAAEIDAKKAEIVEADAELARQAASREEANKIEDATAKEAALAAVAEAEAAARQRKETLQAELVELVKTKQRLEEDEARQKAAAEAEAKRVADEATAGQKAQEEAQRSAAAEAEAKKKAEADAEAKRKADADAEAKRKADADAEAKRKANADVEAKRKAEGDVQGKLAEAERLVVEGSALFREVSTGMRELPDDQDKLKALLKKNEDASVAFSKAKEAFAGVRDRAPASAKIDERVAKIDRILDVLKGYAETIKAKIR